MPVRTIILILFILAGSTAQPGIFAGEPEKQDSPLFRYLSHEAGALMVAYTPSGLDPRYEPNYPAHPTSSIRADLMALKPYFNGLVLYGYHPAATPRILSIARELGFRAVLFGIWEPKSAMEIDGVAELIRQFKSDFAMGVIIGNEGILFKRYESDDLKFAADRLRGKIPGNIPLTTSEPLVSYESDFILKFGDFLAPNIHPAIDRPQLQAAPAAAWAREEAIRLAAMAGKPVLLKETGFPHGGEVKFTPQSQEKFWSSYLSPGTLVRLKASNKVWVYFGVAFEGFDTPWKVEQYSLSIEKSWGLFSVERKAYPAVEVWRETLEKQTILRSR